MFSFQFNGKQLDNKLVTAIPHLLDESSVPNLLWGDYLLTVYGVPTIVNISLLKLQNQPPGRLSLKLFIGRHIQCA